jgi:UDP-GlcNAc:undecaprenyl-phosphate/decaprenyl-phosphate GlcNAc-1-phosphate transferase
MTGFEYFAIALSCAAASIGLCLAAGRVSQLLKLVDVPTGRKKHLIATPLMGGVMILSVFVPISLLYVLANSSTRWEQTLLIWLSCITIMAIVGIADDRHSLSPRARLIVSFLVFASASAIDPTFNIRVLDFEYPRWELGLGTWWLAIIFTVTCCVGLINAINMADGKNGLVLGLSLGWLGLMATRAPSALLPIIFFLGIVLSVLLLFNLKGRLFLGDGGAYAIATALGLLAIMIYNTPGTQAVRSVSADEIMLLFLVPVLDSFRLTYIRLRQGRSPMSADRDHLHHHLQDRFGWPEGLLIYLIIALVPPGTLILAP